MENCLSVNRLTDTTEMNLIKANVQTNSKSPQQLCFSYG